MKALIAMSGGVDSSVAASLMQRQGYECIGCMMKLYLPAESESSERSCCSADAAEDARGVARRLGMPFYVFNDSAAFETCVIDPFVRCYERGMTPNPCIECNRTMKFGELLRRAETLGCERLVTGHYARVEEQDGRYLLKKALDPAKDQSYVLYMLSQEQLRMVRFPLGGLSKAEVRRLAEEQGFLNAAKPESQDICFVPDGDYARFLEERTGKVYPPGDFVNTEGKVLGRHRGIIHYTIGQRRGLGISAEEALYVKSIDPARNTVTLAFDRELYRRELTVSSVNWTLGEVPSGPIRCAAKIRYRHREQPAMLTPLDGGKVRLLFDEPQRAVCPGQSAVFYDGDVVLGGGVICE